MQGLDRVTFCLVLLVRLISCKIIIIQCTR